jgi:hypothetical protein
MEPERTVPFRDRLIHLRRDGDGWRYTLSRKSSPWQLLGAPPDDAAWQGPFPEDADALRHARRRIRRGDPLFSSGTVGCAWDRAQGFCECRESSHAHGSPGCFRPLVRPHRGQARFGGWEARAVTPAVVGGTDEAANCQLFCWRCYRALQRTGG